MDELNFFVAEFWIANGGPDSFFNKITLMIAIFGKIL